MIILPAVPICELYSLENVSQKYVLSPMDLVFNRASGKYSAINFTRSGYPYVTLMTTDSAWRKVTLHKIVALARIHNGPYEIIEHINDNPLDLRHCNLKFSTQRENVCRAFGNGRRDCPARRFRLELVTGQVFEGTMLELQNFTHIPRMTLYDRLYKQQRGIATLYGRSSIRSVVEIEAAPEMKTGLGNRSIDYRKDVFHGKLILEHTVLEI